MKPWAEGQAKDAGSSDKAGTTPAQTHTPDKDVALAIATAEGKTAALTSTIKTNA